MVRSGVVKLIHSNSIASLRFFISSLKAEIFKSALVVVVVVTFGSGREKAELPF